MLVYQRVMSNSSKTQGHTGQQPVQTVPNEAKGAWRYSGWTESHTQFPECFGGLDDSTNKLKTTATILMGTFLTNKDQIN